MLSRVKNFMSKTYLWPKIKKLIQEIFKKMWKMICKMFKEVNSLSINVWKSENFHCILINIYKILVPFVKNINFHFPYNNLHTSSVVFLYFCLYFRVQKLVLFLLYFLFYLYVYFISIRCFNFFDTVWSCSIYCCF